MPITPTTRITGLFGHPVTHSLSPRLHNGWFRELGIDGAYLPFPVTPENLLTALHALPALGIRGINVTVPHKEAVFRALPRLDPAARAIGAVNTVVVGDDGQMTGCNTDASGFVQSVVEYIPTLLHRPALILGAGGAARAVCYGLQQSGLARFRILNRNRERAVQLADDLNLDAEILSTDKSIPFQDVGFIINTTSLGLKTGDALPCPLAGAPADAVAVDLIYNPAETPWLRLAREQGLVTVNGLGMLVHQAAAAFELWFGIKPPINHATFLALEAKP